MIVTKEQIIKELEELKEQKYKSFSNKLTPDTKYKILGVRVPLIRSLVKKYKTEDVFAYLDNPGFTYLEEAQFYGMLLNKQKLSFEQYTYYLEKFIPYVDSWAICDIVCADMNFKEKDKMWNFIQKYLNSDKEFDVRFGIVTILDHYIEEKRLKEIITIVENIKINPYYVQMASAWLLSIMFIKFPEYMHKYLTNNPKLDKFTYNKTLSKITDSYRVSNEYKDKIRKMHMK